MTVETTIVKAVSESVFARTRDYLETELAVTLMQTEPHGGEIDMIALHDVTAIVGVGGAVNLLIAFSFSNTLLDRIFAGFTAEVEIAESERHMYRLETASEVVNIIVGLCTGDMPHGDAAISLSPPVVVQEAKSIRRTKGALFWSQTITTDSGLLDINFVGPREMFDIELNYAA